MEYGTWEEKKDKRKAHPPPLKLWRDRWLKAQGARKILIKNVKR